MCPKLQAGTRWVGAAGARAVGPVHRRPDASAVDRSLRRAAVVGHTLLLSMLVHLGALTFVVGLTLGFLFLLLCLPFFANFLKLFWCSLLAVRLHCDVRVEMVQGAIGFFAAVPSTLIHTLNLFVTPARSLVLLRAWNGYK